MDFQSDILNTSDVCSNCFGLRRRRDATDDPFLNKQWVDKERGPADCVSEQEGTFCQCGLETAYARTWSDDELADAKFRSLLKRCFWTVEQLAVVPVDRRSFLVAALRVWRAHEEPTVNDALEAGFDAALDEPEQTATVSAT